jgi:glycosyltransferase involved in cell wall biosynthesis
MIMTKNYANVSIILPIRNESAYIKKSLDALLAQDYPADHMEILIADGMSTDDTRKIIYNFSLQRPQLKTIILDNPNKIAPTGMNIALRQTKGEIIIRVDGHTIIAPDYVRKCVEHIQKDGIDGVGGFVESIGETHMAKAIAIGMSSPFGVGNSAMRTISGRNMLADTIPFPAYTRQIIERAGFYDEELVRNQDDEYNYRIRKFGGKLLLADDLRYDYFTRTSLKGLWRQYYQYGFWKVRVLQKHPLQMSLRQFVPPAFVASLFISAFLLFFPFPSFILHPSSFILVLYILANLSASLYAASKHGWKYAPLLPLVFAILHISYGLGFLAGLFKFWNRWRDKTGKAPLWSNKTDG